MKKIKTKKLQTKPAFSLIELMVVLVIIGILISFALPNYQKSISNADELAVQTALSVSYLKISRCYYNQLENFKTTTNATQCNFDFKTIKQGSNLEKYLLTNGYQGNYQIQLTPISKNEFVLTATLTDNSIPSDCFELKINQDGVKTSKNNLSVTTKNCWK